MERKLFDAAAKLPETALAFDDIQLAPPVRNWKKATAFAASLMLLVCLGFGTYAVVAEAQEYRAALAFFDEHDLSTQGLSRYEIKAIYLDITTKTFSYSKTAQVIVDSINSNSIPGNDIIFNSPSPNDIENLWNYRELYKQWGSSPEDGRTNIYYDHSSEYQETEDGMKFLYSNVRKFVDGVQVWSIPITEFWVQDCMAVSNGVLAYGRTSYTINQDTDHPWIALIDFNGNLLWTRQLSTGDDYESIDQAVENPDGSYALFTRVITKGNIDLYLYQLSPSGAIHEKHLLILKNRGIENAVRFEDGYLLHLSRYDTPDQIVKVSRTGQITDGFLYKSEEQDYYIADMLEFGGEIYLSAYAVPRTDTTGARREIDHILDYAHAQSLEDGADLTEMTRNNYTAILLRCDPSTGIPQEFFSVQGALGADLKFSETGELIWEVEVITDAYWSPCTSSFSIGGTCCVYRYDFALDGRLTRAEQTFELVSFRR